MASKFGAHTPGAPKCNRLQAVCINPCLTGFGWTPFFNWKVQFFPLFYSWCSAFDPNTHLRINQSKPTCVHTGWRLWVTEKTILSPQFMNYGHQGEGNPKGRVWQYSLPNPELMVLLDPSPIPNPCLTAVPSSGKKEPQMIITLLYIWHTKLGMMYTDDTRVASLNIICHHELRVWETSGGKLGTLTSYRHMRAILPNF